MIFQTEKRKEEVQFIVNRPLKIRESSILSTSSLNYNTLQAKDYRLILQTPKKESKRDLSIEVHSF
jgi:hypothetical protein